jgi:hypothetical protein
MKFAVLGPVLGRLTGVSRSARAAWALLFLGGVLASLLGAGTAQAAARHRPHPRPSAAAPDVLRWSSVPARAVSHVRLTAVIQVDTRRGARATADSGRPITLAVQPAHGSAVALRARDRHGSAVFHWIAGAAGKYALIATAPHLRSTRHRLLVSAGQAPQSLEFLPPLPATAVVGQPLSVTVAVLDASGQTDVTDSGRSITLTVAGTTGGPSVLQATDQDGTAVFSWTPAGPGQALLKAQSDGLTLAEAALQVLAAAPPQSLALVAGSSLDGAVGFPLAIQVDVVSASGEVSTADSGRSLSATLTPQAAGSPITLAGTDTAGVATLLWRDPTAGTYALSVTSPGLEAISGTVQIGAAPTALSLTASATTLPAGQTTTLTASLLGPGGTPQDLQVPLTLRLAAGSVGTLAEVASVMPAPGSAAATFAAGDTPGSATVLAQVGTLTAQLMLTVTPLGSLVFSAPAYAGTAGLPTAITVTLQPAAGATLPPGPLQVTLTVTPPGGGAGQSYQAPVVSGAASFAVSEDAAGAYTLAATAPGMTAAATATLQVSAAAPASLTVTASATDLLPGQAAVISVSAEDAFGNAIPASAPFAVAVTATPTTLGTLTSISAQPTGPGEVARFTAGQVGGHVTVTVATQGGLEGQVTIDISPSRAAVVAGKGMWLMYQDWKQNGGASLVRTAVQDHISYLFLEVATTHDGFYGRDALNNLLPLAHAAHIRVIAWVYTALYDPAADAQMSVDVARYRTPGGQRVDGLAADIEAVTTSQAVGAYARAVRRALPDMPFVAVTYPPLYHMNYPYAVLAKYVDAIAPMDYWHSMPKAYSESYVYRYVENSIATIRTLDGNPRLPISVIGQAYDMFTDSGTGPNNPTPAEITGGFRASEAEGAIGFSLYRWGTATSAEWKLWATMEWSA